MARLEVASFKKRHAKAFQVRDNFRSLYEEGYKYALPFRNPFDESVRTGSNPVDYLFDSTLMHQTLRLANRLQREVTPAFTEWATLIPGKLIPKELKAEAGKQLEAITNAGFAAIHISNFDTAAHEFYLDLCVGTGAIRAVRNDDETPVQFETANIGTLALEEGPYGTIGGVYRKIKVAARNVEATWKDAKLSDEFKKATLEKPDEEVEFLEGTYTTPGDKTVHYDVICTKAKARNEERIVERDLRESEWIIARWVKLPGVPWGFGPALFSLPDSRVLNRLKDLVLQNASMAIGGVYTAVDDDTIDPNTVEISTGNIITVGAQGNLAPLESSHDFGVADLVAADMVDSIKQMMHGSTLPPEEGGVRSATELNLRQLEHDLDIGSPVGRVIYEGARPIMQKTINILADMGIIKNLQGNQIKIDGGAIDMRVVSKFARSQDLTDVQTAIQWLDVLKNIDETLPAMGAKVEDFPEWSATKLGVSNELVRGADEREQIKQKMAQAVEAQGAEALAQ